MKYKKILFLESGGPAAISAIKILKKTEPLIYLIAADSDPYSPSFELANKGIVVPKSDDPAFVPTIQEIICKEQIDLVFPCFEHGFDRLSSLKENFLTDFASAMKCKDKLGFYLECRSKNIPVPNTVSFEDVTSQTSWPLYIKPRFGVGSRENYIVKNYEEYKALKIIIKGKGEFIAQELLVGNHWNVDVLVENDVVLAAIPRLDIKQREGNCITVKVECFQKLIEFAKYIQKDLEIKSTFNLEVFETKPNKFVINEINVRLGGGVIFGALSGVDIVSYLASGNKKYLGNLQEGVYTRYYEELKIR